MAVTPTTPAPLDTSRTSGLAWPRFRGRGTQRQVHRDHAALIFLTGVAIYFLLPLYWLFISATKNNGDLFSTFGLWFGSKWSLGANLHELFTYDHGIYIQWLFNSLLYAAIGGGVATFLATMMGYAIAKYVFPGRNLLFSVVIGAILVPVTALALPLYLLMSKWGLVNTYWAVLLPSCVSPLGVYLARIYAASSIPDELLDAARIDGASEWRIFSTIVLPILAPALVTIFLFQFVGIWNNFFLPLVVLSDEHLYPVTLGLQALNISPAFNNQVVYNLIVTGSLISVIPLVILFLVLQRYWRSGLALGSVKG